MRLMRDRFSTSGSARTCIRIDRENESRCRQISETYGLPVADEVHKYEFDYGLVFEQGILTLRDIENPKFRSICMSVHSVARLSRKNLLGRAIGRKVNTIVDGTAGLGADAMLMARMGYCVTTVERSPVFAALIEDGISQIESRTANLSINQRFGDTRSILPDIEPPPDAVYLDPMFPKGRKPSVKVVRPLEVLRDITNDDSDADELFESAIRHATRRVIVKRPNFAGSIQPDRLSMSIRGKLVRYDIYLVKN